MLEKRFLVMSALAMAPPAAIAGRHEADSGAEISMPLAISNVTPLHFGTLYPNQESPVTISVKTSGVACDHPETMLSSDQTPAEFSVSGRDGAVYTVQVPDDVLLTSQSGATLVADLMPVGPGYLEDGVDSFFVGSSMVIPPRQATDSYIGTFMVTVAYQ